MEKVIEIFAFWKKYADEQGNDVYCGAFKGLLDELQHALPEPPKNTGGEP